MVIIKAMLASLAGLLSQQSLYLDSSVNIKSEIVSQQLEQFFQCNKLKDEKYWNNARILQ